MNSTLLDLDLNQMSLDNTGTIDYSLLFFGSWIFMIVDWLLFLWWSADTDNEVINMKTRIHKMENKIYNDSHMNTILDAVRIYAQEKTRTCNQEIIEIENNIAMYNAVLEMLKDIDYVSIGHLQRRQNAIEYMKDFFPGIPVCNLPKVFFYKPAHIKMQIAEQTREIVKKLLSEQEAVLETQNKIIEKFNKMQSVLS